MTIYAQHVQTRSTPQSEPIPGSNQVANSAGGYSFPVDDWTRLDRFLILGSEGGSYYASERQLTRENATCVLKCAALDAERTVNTIAAISESSRAPKNDPAIFALALLASTKAGGYETDDIRQRALAALPSVCRTGTHLFQFAESVNALRGWGRGLRRAIGNWYLGKNPRNLAYQATKYQQRNGWSHRDLLRLSHPHGDGLTNDILHWIVKGWPGVGDDPHPSAELLPIWAFERAKRAATKQEVVRLIRDHDLVRECVPTVWLNEAEVWEALLEKMPLTALVRNLATMTRVGLIAPLSEGTRRVMDALGDTERLRKSRLHPLAILTALLTYAAGHGMRGQNTWAPVQPVVDALDRTFYAAFQNVEPTGKRWLLALDVSGSMSSGMVGGVYGLTPRKACAALALVTANVEPAHGFVGFSHQLVNVPISPRQRLDDVVRTMDRIPMGGTDCALPMLWAAQNRVPVDVFCVLTDNETWCGGIHPCQALVQYRQKMGIAAKLAVVGMISNGFSIADPKDGGMMDFVGMDSAGPQVLADFARAG